jgi:hypothetical protein
VPFSPYLREFGQYSGLTYASPPASPGKFYHRAGGWVPEQTVNSNLHCNFRFTVEVVQKHLMTQFSGCRCGPWNTWNIFPVPVSLQPVVNIKSELANVLPCKIRGFNRLREFGSGPVAHGRNDPVLARRDRQQWLNQIDSSRRPRDSRLVEPVEEAWPGIRRFHC